MKLQYKSYEIEIIDDNYHSAQSLNNSNKYKYEYSDGKPSTTRTFKINKRGLILTEKETGIEIASAILYENGGRTQINEKKYKIQEEEIWLCVGDSIYCLSLPTLTINWYHQTEIGTTYSIIEFQNEFIIYGEFGILRITNQGVKQWQFMGGDGIFKEGEGRFQINENVIKLEDENGKVYLIDQNGTRIN